MVQHSEWVTYVENPPENPSGVYCANAELRETRDDPITNMVRIYRPVVAGTVVPEIVNFKRRNTYISVMYDDGCTCHCYYNKEPIRAHQRLARYAPDDDFQLDFAQSSELKPHFI